MLLSLRESGPREGPTVVLLHGIGTSGWMWRQLVADLRGDLHVLNVDLPGHGRSSARSWASLSETTSAVAEVIRARAHDGVAHLVGLSLGGYVAVNSAALNAGLVRSAVVSGVNLLPFPHPRLMRAAGRVMSPLMTLRPVLRANARALGVPGEDFEGYAEAARMMAPGTLTRVGAELMDYRPPAESAGSASRVLAIAGGDEHQLIVRSLSELAAAFPHGQARVAPGLGHAWNGQAPELFAHVVRAQVTGQPLPEGLLEVNRLDADP